jgi:hypothetical protein
MVSIPAHFSTCIDATTRAEQCARDIQRTLDQSTELSTHISAVSSSSVCPSATDAAITHVEEKENNLAVSVLRRRLATTGEQKQYQAANKAPRLL